MLFEIPLSREGFDQEFNFEANRDQYRSKFLLQEFSQEQVSSRDTFDMKFPFLPQQKSAFRKKQHFPIEIGSGERRNVRKVKIKFGFLLIQCYQTNIKFCES